jgi:CheY-like chemotaxis protein
MRTKSVLIIEDNEPIRRLIAGYLITSGYEVLEAEDGYWGLEYSRQFQPDLVLCDVMMPGLSGFDVLRGIRNDTLIAQTPCVLISSNDDPDALEMGRTLGAQAFLIKPILYNALRDIVDGYLA